MRYSQTDLGLYEVMINRLSTYKMRMMKCPSKAKHNERGCISIYHRKPGSGRRKPPRARSFPSMSEKGSDQMTTKKPDWKAGSYATMFKKEAREHPSFSKANVRQIVVDHMRKKK